MRFKTALLTTALLSSIFAFTPVMSFADTAEQLFKQGKIAYDQGNYAEAFKWYKKAAEQGGADSQFYLGIMHVHGLGVKQEYQQAVKWFKRAVEQGDAGAQLSLGGMYVLGKGVRQNKSLAKEWYGKACDNGYQKGCDNYRELNERGRSNCISQNF
ncbi:tetratricopeptide repeat protein [[Haemophilus] felis]|nr:tetratricopeptide repeat protein [[Haemophilus] felis]